MTMFNIAPQPTMNQRMQHEDEKERRGIQSIEVGGQLLVALSNTGNPMTLKQLAEAADMTPAKAHPYLVSFGKIGLVAQDPVSGSPVSCGDYGQQRRSTCNRSAFGWAQTRLAQTTDREAPEPGRPGLAQRPAAARDAGLADPPARRGDRRLLAHQG